MPAAALLKFQRYDQLRLGPEEKPGPEIAGVAPPMFHGQSHHSRNTPTLTINVALKKSGFPDLGEI
ncbi:hypothetical protein GCM10011324_22090 [Allosediminivita pacifica]|nr:hypothetical protein GCM10011324_22090 [Allosediminivita pacifica]